MVVITGARSASWDQFGALVLLWSGRQFVVWFFFQLKMFVSLEVYIQDSIIEHSLQLFILPSPDIHFN